MLKYVPWFNNQIIISNDRNSSQARFPSRHSGIKTSANYIKDICKCFVKVRTIIRSPKVETEFKLTMIFASDGVRNICKHEILKKGIFFLLFSKVPLTDDVNIAA